MTTRDVFMRTRKGPTRDNWVDALRDLESAVVDALVRVRQELAAFASSRDTYLPKLVTTTVYEFRSEDAERTVVSTSASATTFRIPTGLTVPIGGSIRVYQQGSGTLTVTAATGVTLRAVSTAAMSGQYGRGTIQRISAHEWSVQGDFA